MDADKKSFRSQFSWTHFKKMFFQVKNDLIEHGVKYTFKKYGWKLGVAIFLYYLIRDSIIYLIIPALVGYGFLHKN